MNLMIDFETMGNTTDTIVVSLGACLFNNEGIHKKALWYYDLYEQQKAGRTWTASTLAWWMKQDADARSVFYDSKTERLPMKKFFEVFEKWLDEGLEEHLEGRDELKVWGNGESFDVSILKDLYLKHHPKGEHAVPWKFWNGCCFRMFNRMTKVKEKMKMKGAAHNALDDAIYQAECVIAVMNKKVK